jgi:hypothetical protein
MRALMSFRLSIASAALLAVVACFGAAGCGHDIGDSCTVSTDCATDGTRECDESSPSGYCTIAGCDYDTCPSEATCVRFYTGGFTNLTCDPTTEDDGESNATDNCSIDELCSLNGYCVPRSAEVRYCMKTCSSNGDCRDGYECRDLTLQSEHGGEDVLAPGDMVSTSSPKFCAPAPASN